MINTSFFSPVAMAILFVSLCSFNTIAREHGGIPNQETLENLKQEGQFFSVHISLREPIRIFVVGREEAKFDPSKLTLTVRRLKPYPGKVLSVDRYHNYFQVNDPKEFRKAVDLEIVTHTNNKDETFKFKLNNKMLH